jgi:hypothetical protein
MFGGGGGVTGFWLLDGTGAAITVICARKERARTRDEMLISMERVDI